MIRRWLAWVLAVALLAFGLLWPAIFGAGPARGTHRDPVRFTDYRADFSDRV
ncbi:hypothetical protein [Mycolicibacterium sp. 050158]|jgi:hypothetical protein|uniref:hypothetical protein n=1 Tax=Mycolicibacterium sp. 050158 TaxID=3090602 RepID=UPI00299F05F2|nr:hypothetical protein [Mycolicibacterium sp. 050158]MDX1891624.1 hypothetical protein [Mycolicibacterium sp. 050158]